MTMIPMTKRFNFIESSSKSATRRSEYTRDIAARGVSAFPLSHKENIIRLSFSKLRVCLDAAQVQLFLCAHRVHLSRTARRYCHYRRAGCVVVACDTGLPRVSA